MSRYEMTGGPRWLRAGGLALGILFFFSAAPATAEVGGLGRWEGDVTVRFDFSREDQRFDTGVRTIDEHNLAEERLTLRNVGAYIYDPGLVTLTLGGSFGLTQERFVEESDGASDEKRDIGRLLGYELAALFLPEKAISLRVFANRDESVVPMELISRTEILTENRGAKLKFTRLYIPSEVVVQQDFFKQDTRSSASVFLRDEQDKIIRYEGKRGWVDAEMNVRYEYIDHVDNIRPDLTYQSHEGNLISTVQFGTELNWRWDSRIRFFDRAGTPTLAVTNLTVDELLRIDHTERLKTDFRYVLNHTNTPLGGEVTTHAPTVTLRHQLYESLKTTFTLDPRFERLSNGEKNMYRGGVDLVYTKLLPWDGLLTANLGASLAYEDDRFDDIVASAVNELHTATTPFARPIELDNLNVVQSSVVVTKVAVGPLPPGCAAFPVPVPLTDGVDYTLRTVGNATEIVPLPCSLTNPGINPGDTIAVDYQYAVSPSSTFTTIAWRLGLNVDYGWIRPYIILDYFDQSLLEGDDDSFLNDRQSNTVGTEFRYDGERLQASLVGEAQRYVSQRSSTYNRVRSSQFLRYRILPELILVMSGNQDFRDYSDPEGRKTRTLWARANLRYTLNASLTADAFAEWRDYTDTLDPDERTMGGGLVLKWRYRQVQVTPRLTFIRRRRAGSDSMDYRATLDIVRRF